jgi:uncharacterized damage-inducible protein DinB
MNSVEYFRTLAKYNAWANNRLYQACLQLPQEEYDRQRPAFFKSIHGTLNHIMVADELWLARLKGETAPNIKSLDQILFQDRLELASERQKLDQKIETAMSALSEAQIQGDLTYKLMSRPGEFRTTPMRFALAHIFNHQTHHRGQVHDQLSQTTAEPPSMDIIYFINENSAST